MKTLIVSTLIFISLNLHAEIDNPSDQIFVNTLPEIEKLGGWSSGGGNAVVCFNNEDYLQYLNSDGSLKNEAYRNGIIESIETYDLFEARLPRGIDQSEIPEIITINPDENIAPYISRLSNRYKNFVSPVSNIVTSGKKSIPDTNVRFYNGAVTQNKDYNPAIILNDKNCIVTTIANQHSNNGFYELFIDARAFNHPAHSKLSKAALILHEYVYAIARSLGQEDSHSTRKVIEILITKNPDYTARYVASLIKNLNFMPLDPNDLLLIDLTLNISSLIAESMRGMDCLFKQDGLQDPDFQEFFARLKKYFENFGIPLDRNLGISDTFKWYKSLGPIPNLDQNLIAELHQYHYEALVRLSLFTKSKIQHILSIIENIYGNIQDKITLTYSTGSFLNMLSDTAGNYNYLSSTCSLNRCNRLELMSSQGDLRTLFIEEYELNNLLILDHTPHD